MNTSRYVSVTGHADKVAIVATGSSLKGVDLVFGNDVAVIAVNAAINHLRRTDYWFTLDPSPDNQDIMRKPIRGVTYYAALPDSFTSVPGNVRVLQRVSGTGHGRYMTKGGLSPDKRAIHTGNSAWGALQLAVHLGATRIALFGVDGAGPYHYGGRPRELGMMPALFASALGELTTRKVSVVNGSPDSEVRAFTLLTPEEAMKWINV